MNNPSGIFWTNTSIISVCICFILEIIAAGTNTWYIRHHDVIKYRHGGLWQQCMGDIKRTFCTPKTLIPEWLQASRILIVVALAITFCSIIYVMVAMARKKLSLSIMIAMNNIKTFTFLIGVIVYSAKGYPTNFTPGASFYAAWVTCLLQLMTSLLWFYACIRVGKMTKLEIYEAGYKA